MPSNNAGFGDLRAKAVALLRTRVTVRPEVTAADLRHWLRLADPPLVAMAHLAEPVALALLVLTGLITPLLTADWAPIPAVRATHLLAGLVLVLVLVFRIVMLGIQGVRWLARRPGASLRRLTLPPSAGWRRVRDPMLEVAYQVALAVMVVSGVEHALARRNGEPLLGLLSAAELQALHAVAAPYFYTALLLLSYVEGRKRARVLLNELRSP
jgi:hypothetical protein